MSYVLTTEWDSIQERNIEPLSPVHADNHNKLLKILGSSKMYIDGLNHSFTFDDANKKVIMHLTPGIVVIQNVCIEFKENTSIVFLDNENNLQRQNYYVVVEYEYRNIRPLGVAQIKSINSDEYNSDIHLKLYHIYTDNWYSFPTESAFNAWVSDELNFEDLRTNIDNLPAWLTANFMPMDGGSLTGTILVPNPSLDDQAANKGYVDNLIENHTSLHMDDFVSITGSTMSGVLYLSEHPDESVPDPLGSTQAATKGYVDFWANHMTETFGVGPFLPLYGGSMTGFLKLNDDPTDLLHAATKNYVDERIEEVVNFSEGPFLPLSGGEMTGHIVLIDNPSENFHPVTKVYADTSFAGISHTHDASDLTSGSLSSDRGVVAGSPTYSFVKYTGTANNIGVFYGGTTAPSSSQRLNYNGYFYASRVYNAVYNDFADCLYLDADLTFEDSKNKIVELCDNNTVRLASRFSRTIIGVISDTYAYIAGGTEEEIQNNIKAPICSAGYAWVNVENVEKAELGFYIMPADNGIGKVISFDEKTQYNDFIVGKIIAIDKATNKVRISIIMN